MSFAAVVVVKPLVPREAKSVVLLVALWVHTQVSIDHIDKESLRALTDREAKMPLQLAFRSSYLRDDPGE